MARVQFEDWRAKRFENVDMTGAVFKETMLVNVRMSGLIHGLVINDIEVAPLISAEMDRRYPERTKLRPTDADGCREAWRVVSQLWAATMDRAASLDDPLLRERVDDEWSFLETVRHLIFVIDAWISGTVLGQKGQFHPFGVAPSFITDVEPFGIDTTADPSLADVRAARNERQAIVDELVADLTDDDLRRQCGDHTLHHCLLTLFEEEWAHHWYATRDLDALLAESG